MPLVCPHAISRSPVIDYYLFKSHSFWILNLCRISLHAALPDLRLFAIDVSWLIVSFQKTNLFAQLNSLKGRAAGFTRWRWVRLWRELFDLLCENSCKMSLEALEECERKSSDDVTVVSSGLCQLMWKNRTMLHDTHQVGRRSQNGDIGLRYTANVWSSVFWLLHQISSSAASDFNDSFSFISFPSVRLN